QLRYLLADAAKSLGDMTPQLVGYLDVAPTYLDPHFSSSGCLFFDCTTSQAPGKGDRSYPDRARATQGPRGGREGGPGGQHVVDEEDAARRLAAGLDQRRGGASPRPAPA